MSVAPEPIDSLGDGLARFYAFLVGQGFGDRVDGAAARAARGRNDLGITSLEIIMLIANYMSARGVDTDGFQPEWVSRLDDVEGIVWVMAQIDRHACLA
jgi:hypothetical protein